MIQEIIIAGFGGQGVMTMGKFLSYAGMLEGKNVTYLPSYGPEMRGGTANCTVVISDEEIGSPLVSNPDAVIVMNNPSLTKFEKTIKPGGTMIINSSLVTLKPTRTDIKIINVPANEMALEIGEGRIANMVALGAYVASSGVVKVDSVMEALRETLPPHRHNLLPLNEKALTKGASVVK